MKTGKNKTNFILPLIDTSQTLRLMKKTLAVNAPNEGNLTRIFERKIG